MQGDREMHEGRGGRGSGGGPTRRRVLQCVVLATALLLGVATLQVSAAASSFLWKATGPKGGTVYLAGSLHLLTDAFYPLAPAFDDAFGQADLLVEELDMAEMTAPSAQMLMLQRGMMPAGQSLASVLSPETMAGVKTKAAELGLPIEPLQLFKPWALSLTLEGMEWQKAGFDPDLGLDKHFYDLAKTRGMAVQGLETLEFQIAQFDGMPMPLQDRLLAESLKEMASANSDLDEMARAWKAGDVGATEKLVLSDLKSEPQVYERLLLARNRNWMPKLEALFQRPRPSFVVVGAAHLVGTDGIVAQLRARGYTVTQM